MKKIIVLGLIVSLFVFSACDNRIGKEKLAVNLRDNLSKVFDERYQLKIMGWSGRGDENYSEMGLFFCHFGVMSKDEGRKMLVDCANEFLNKINSNSLLLPFLQPSPFTINNIKMCICVSHPDGSNVFWPDFYAFSIRKGKITYHTRPPKSEFFTQERESFEEALKIVQS